MFKLLFCLLSLCIISFHLQAQQGKKEDVLYLKNKWVIRGKIVERSDTTLSRRHTEAQINGFGEKELPEEFGKDEYQVLLDADMIIRPFLFLKNYSDRSCDQQVAKFGKYRPPRLYKGARWWIEYHHYEGVELFPAETGKAGQ